MLLVHFSLKAIQFLAMVLKVFDHFILANEPFAKALQSFDICVLVNTNLHGKLFSLLESPTTFDESFKVTSAPFFFQILIY